MYTAGYSAYYSRNLYAENIGVIPDIYDVCHLYRRWDYRCCLAFDAFVCRFLKELRVNIQPLLVSNSVCYGKS